MEAAQKRGEDVNEEDYLVHSSDDEAIEESFDDSEFKAENYEESFEKQYEHLKSEVEKRSNKGVGCF